MMGNRASAYRRKLSDRKSGPQEYSLMRLLNVAKLGDVLHAEGGELSGDAGEYLLGLLLAIM